MAELYVPKGRKLCGECRKQLIPQAGSTTANACRKLGVCFSCFDPGEAREIPGPRREIEMSETAPPGHGHMDVGRAVLSKEQTCAHCGSRAIAKGACATSVAATKLSVCSTCYKDSDVIKARREAMGLGTHGVITPAGSTAAGRATPAKRQGSAPPARIPKERRLPAPAGSTAGPVPARTRRPRPPTPAAPDRRYLRSAIVDVLKEGYARYAIDELRAVADHMEDELES